jgi:putative membrane protein
MIKQFLTLLLKGMAMGAANVIPGVSGGTIALITGVFKRLINAIKSFDIKALKLLLTGKFKEFATYTDLIFLASLFLGVGIAILSLAKLLDYLFKHQPVYVWAFFFGLVLASVWFVGKTVKTWHFGSVTTFIIGTAIALAISVMTPASENASFFYLIICGIVAICSMILPGLSGSFVLILMGNYQLIMIQAVSQFNFAILLPVAIGCVIGLIAFSHFLSWLLKQFPDSTISLLTGFILGSLGILWPWKTELTQTFGEKTKVIGYQWHWPETNETLVWAIVFIILGLATITVTEILGKTKIKNTQS